MIVKTYILTIYFLGMIQEVRFNIDNKWDRLGYP